MGSRMRRSASGMNFNTLPCAWARSPPSMPSMRTTQAAQCRLASEKVIVDLLRRCAVTVSVANTLTIGQTTRIPTVAEQMGADLLLRGALLFDGSGAERRRGDVAIASGRIQAVGDLASADAGKVIDLDGLALAPGFIDVHTHDDRLLLADPSMAPKVSQGVTTVVVGNCGISLAPLGGFSSVPPLNLLANEGDAEHFRSFADYFAALEAHPAAINCTALIG